MQEKTVLLIEPPGMKSAHIILWAASNMPLVVDQRLEIKCADDTQLRELVTLLYPGPDETAGENRALAKRRLRKQRITVVAFSGEDAVAKLDRLVGESVEPIRGRLGTAREIFGSSVVHCPVDAASAEWWLKFFFSSV